MIEYLSEIQFNPLLIFFLIPLLFFFCLQWNIHKISHSKLKLINLSRSDRILPWFYYYNLYKIYKNKYCRHTPMATIADSSIAKLKDFHCQIKISCNALIQTLQPIRIVLWLTFCWIFFMHMDSSISHRGPNIVKIYYDINNVKSSQSLI